MNYTIHTPGTAPEAAKQTLTALQEHIGFIPNIVAVIAESPTALTTVAAINMALEQSGLDPIEQRVVTITVSASNRCSYCVPAQSAMAEMAEMPDDILKQLREQRPLSDKKLNALRDFVVLVVNNKGWVPEKDVTTFINAGYSKQQVFDVLSILALMTLTNYVGHITGVQLDDNFTAHQWRQEDNEVV